MIVALHIYHKSFGIRYAGPPANKIKILALIKSSKLREHGRHAMLSFLRSLPIPVLRILDIEANRFYDSNHQMYEAALLTRCYTQHALRPFIDAEINHQKHFSPDYYSEPPIICYKFNKPIRHTIFNFNKLVSDLDIHANTPSS